MVKKPKERLLETGAMLILEKGYNCTGINDILKKASVPKGSFYFYFKNKEEFGLQVIDYFEEFITPIIHKYFDDTKINEIERLRKFFKHMAKMVKEMGFKGGCPLGNLAQEMCPSNDEFRKKLKRFIGRREKRISGLIESSGIIKKNSIPMSPIKLAEYIFACWEGTVIKMKLEKNLKPFKTFETAIFNNLLSEK